LINWRTISARRQHSTDDLRKANREIYVETENELRKALFAGSSISAKSPQNTAAMAKLSIVITRDLFISKTVNIPPVGGITIRSINGAVIAPYHDGDSFPLFRWLRSDRVSTDGISLALGLRLENLSLIGVSGKGAPFRSLLVVDETSTTIQFTTGLEIVGCKTPVSPKNFLFECPVAPAPSPGNGAIMTNCIISNNMSGWGIHGSFANSIISDNVIGNMDFHMVTAVNISNNVPSVYGTMTIDTAADGNFNVVTGNRNTAAPVGFIAANTVVANNVL